MRDPILIRPGDNGRAIWWIAGQSRPDPERIDAKEASINAMINRKAKRAERFAKKINRTEDGWTNEGVLIVNRQDDESWDAHRRLDIEFMLAVLKDRT